MENLAENRKARFDYEILDTYEAGIALTGPEVKSAREGKIQLGGSHVLLKPKGAFLFNAIIQSYQPNNPTSASDPTRTRQLLLNKKELNFLLLKVKERGLTVIPLSIYTKGRRVKLSIALAKHKKAHDKREAIKKRETSREIRRSLKS